MPRVAVTLLANCQSARIGLFRFYRHSAITARQPGSGCRLSKQSMPIEHSSSMQKRHTFNTFVSL